MVSHDQSPQRIARLTPLKDVLSFLDAQIRPLEARYIDIPSAVGRVLAEDCICPGNVPAKPTALRDGWAVLAESTMDASAYTPALSGNAVRIDTGRALPSDTDAILPLEAGRIGKSGLEIVAPVPTSDGVLQRGGDVAAKQTLLRAGDILRPLDCAALLAAGIATVAIQQPQLKIVTVCDAEDPVILAAGILLRAYAEKDGVDATLIRRDKADFEFQAPLVHDCDALIIVGGTGVGSDDRSVVTLYSSCNPILHGIALSPGDTAAVAICEGKPVLVFPGRLDAAIACWLAFGRHALDRLTGRIRQTPSRRTALLRKIASPIGVADFILVRCEGDSAEPIASRYWPMHAIVRANGFVAVDAGSEGFPAGADVIVTDLP